ncbi:MAG: hypothetical protein ROO76_12115 [Terriglobia bacterium]|jgi:hypothetical protein|nr:hypothetical protein [Terriglobia bacterium]
MNRLRIVGVLLAIVMGVASTAMAQTGIKAVVSVLERRYSVRHHGVPGLWLAKPFMFGSGVSGLKMAEFDDFRIPSRDVNALQAEVGRALGSEWSPFVETWSNSHHEWSTIYARQEGSHLELLIVDSDEDGCMTVLQMKVSGKARAEWISQPAESAGRADANHDQGAED